MSALQSKDAIEMSSSSEDLIKDLIKRGSNTVNNTKCEKVKVIRVFPHFLVVSSQAFSFSGA